MCRDKGLPVRTWCFQEVLKTELNASGWMDPAFIERKRASVPAQLFRVEYELGEPAGGPRAFDLTLLNKAFIHMDTCSEGHSTNDDEWVFEEPQATGWYAIGADWAKEKDKTVIVVARVDEKPWRIVYLRAVNRKPYPEMAAMFNDALMKYQAVAAHDGTGIGNVINDYIDERAHKVLMVGRGRTELLVDYINAVEKGVYRLPANTPAFDAHKGTTVDEVYAPGKWNSHLSNYVAAFSIMHNAATKQAPAAAGEGVPRSAYVSRSHRDLTYGPTEQVVSMTGDVRVVQVDDNPHVISWLVRAAWVKRDGRHIETTVFSRWRTHLNGNILRDVSTLTGQSPLEEWYWRWVHGRGALRALRQVQRRRKRQASLPCAR